METMINDNDIYRLKGTSDHPRKDQIALIGPASGGLKIRTEFNLLESNKLLEHLSDLGDLHPRALGSIDQLMSEFSESEFCTIFITPPQFVQELDDSFWASHSRPVVMTNRPRNNNENTAFIGIQRHLYPSKFEYSAHQHIRLGEIRSNMERAEVLLRNADCIIIDLAVLKLSDNLGSRHSSTAGLMIEELCMIAKYAGASVNLKTIVINGFDQNQDDFGMMAKNISLLLFYILDGFDIRKREMIHSEQLQRYTVLPDHCSQELVFIEDQRSGRWWVELFSDGAEKEVKMACTKQDYEDACNNRISERLTALLALA